MLQMVCPVCLQRQLSRPIDRDDAPWTEYYCPTHGPLSYVPRTRWDVETRPESAPQPAERPA